MKKRKRVSLKGGVASVQAVANSVVIFFNFWPGDTITYGSKISSGFTQARFKIKHFSRFKDSVDVKRGEFSRVPFTFFVSPELTKIFFSDMVRSVVASANVRSGRLHYLVSLSSIFSIISFTPSSWIGPKCTLLSVTFLRRA